MRIRLGAAKWLGIAVAACLALAARPLEARAPAKKPAGKQAPAKSKPTQPKPAQPRPAGPARPAPLRGVPPAPPLERLSTERATLPSGLRVVVARGGGAGRVAVATSFGAGRAYEGAGEHGASDMLGAALERAAAREPGLVAAGASTRVVVDDDAVTVTSEGAREELDRIVDAHLGWVGAGKIALGDAAARPDPSAEGRLRALVYQGFAPYAGEARPTGSTAAQTAFARTMRVAPRAAIAVTGDVDPHAELERLRQRAPAGSAPARPTAIAGSHPEQTNQRTEEVVGDEAGLLYGWALRGAADADLGALELARHVLVARIMAAAAGDGRIAIRDVEASLEVRNGPSAWVLRVTPAPGADVARVRAAVERALSSFGSEPVDEAALAAARRVTASTRLAVRERSDALATELARAEHLAGGATGRVEPHLGQVTPTSLRSAATRYLGPLTRSVVVVRQEAAR